MIDRYLKQLEAVGVQTGPAWLQGLRAGAMNQFRKVGLPSPRDEEWRFTPLGPLVRQEFGPPARIASISVEDLGPFLFDQPDWARVVLVDGRFDPALSALPRQVGVAVQSLAEVLGSNPASIEPALGRHVPAEATPFAALNTAVANEGVVIRIDAGVTVDAPIHVLHLTSAECEGAAVHPRMLVLAGREARLQLIESYVTLAPRARYWTNTVCEVAVGEAAWVEHSRIQRESESAFHIGVTQVTQSRDSHYRSFSFAMGAAIARHDLNTRLAAPNTESLLYGLYFGRGDQLVDNHTTIYHDEPNCRSWEVYKGILTDRSRGVFNGKILVKPEAQKTDAKQTNRVLLLSDSARIDTKPQLEIFADDVKCTHGATVGDLDAGALFYLQSRGMPREAARRLLVYAFAAEVLNEVSSKAVRSVLDALVHARLAVEA